MANGHNSIISNLCTTNLVTTATDKRIPSAFGSHYVSEGLVHPLFILGERYISDNESSSWNFYAGVWESEEALPRGWTARMINAKINSAPGNGTNCWDLLIVFEGFLLIIHPERTEGWGVLVLDLSLVQSRASSLARSSYPIWVGSVWKWITTGNRFGR